MKDKNEVGLIQRVECVVCECKFTNLGSKNKCPKCGHIGVHLVIEVIKQLDELRTIENGKVGQ